MTIGRIIIRKQTKEEAEKRQSERYLKKDIRVEKNELRKAVKAFMAETDKEAMAEQLFLIEAHARLISVYREILESL